MPTRKANARTGTTSIIEANNAMKKASRPVAMQPRLTSELLPPGLVWPVTHDVLAGLGVRLPSQENR